jgi:hypothetical protein
MTPKERLRAAAERHRLAVARWYHTLSSADNDKMHKAEDALDLAWDEYGTYLRKLRELAS